MELRQLRYFVAVAEELHFGRAAAKLGMAQPPLSQQIIKLERQMETSLFVRASSGVRLTPAGEAFLIGARSALAGIDAAVDAAQRVARAERDRLAVGIIPSVMDGEAPRLLHAFKERRPDVILEIQPLRACDIAASLRSGKVDIAFTRRLDGVTGIVQIVIAREALVAALPKGHRLAARETIAVADLAQETFVLFDRTGNLSLRDAIEGTCREAGYSPHVGTIGNEIHALIAMVAAGAGVSIVPEALRNVKRDGVVYRTIVPSTRLIDVVVARRVEDDNPVVLDFASDIRAMQ